MLSAPLSRDILTPGGKGLDGESGPKARILLKLPPDFAGRSQMGLPCINKAKKAKFRAALGPASPIWGWFRVSVDSDRKRPK